MSLCAFARPLIATRRDGFITDHYQTIYFQKDRISTSKLLENA